MRVAEQDVNDHCDQGEMLGPMREVERPKYDPEVPCETGRVVVRAKKKLPKRRVPSTLPWKVCPRLPLPR